MTLNTFTTRAIFAFALAFLCAAPIHAQTTQQQPQPQSQIAPAPHAIVLHAARLLDVESGRITAPGEILIEADVIKEVGTKVTKPSDARIIDLGDSTLLPGLIDAHVHLFLHPGAEDLQTVQESVPRRTITATLAARADLLAGFTAERDMAPKVPAPQTPLSATPSIAAKFPARACASAATPSTFSAATKTPSVTTPSSTFSPM